MSEQAKTKLEIVQDRINQYDIRFPVATLAKELRLNKGYVSGVLNGQKPISDNFWETFNKKYPAQNGQQAGTPLPGAHPTLQDHINEIKAHRAAAEAYASKLEAEKNRLYSIIETYLNSIQANSVKTQDDLKILKAQADIVIKQIAHQDEAIFRSQLQKSEIVKGDKAKRGM